VEENTRQQTEFTDRVFKVGECFHDPYCEMTVGVQEVNGLGQIVKGSALLDIELGEPGGKDHEFEIWDYRARLESESDLPVRTHRSGDSPNWILQGIRLADVTQ
jgi:hypothetical protein